MRYGFVHWFPGTKKQYEASLAQAHSDGGRTFPRDRPRSRRHRRRLDRDRRLRVEGELGALPQPDAPARPPAVGEAGFVGPPEETTVGV